MLEWMMIAAVWAQDPRPMNTAAAKEVRVEVARCLVREVETDSEKSDEDRLTALCAVIDSGVQRLGDSSRVGIALSDAIRRSTGDGSPAKRLSALRSFVRERSLDLAFLPRTESPRPAGFPDATPVGEIAVLDYPTYRLASVPIPRGPFGGRGGAFWKLFRHIDKNKISMTAPVEMTYAVAKGDEPERMQTMAFLYASTDIGRLGLQGDVEVRDVPAVRVVSSGLRGSDDDAAFERAVVDLRAWLAQHREWIASGPPRVMAWNSPMVRDSERFFEVQLPIAAAPPKDAPAALDEPKSGSER